MISIIIPVYNVEKYLGECLESIYKQTYKDIEVIIVNDGSTDKSTDIINMYKNMFVKIIYIEQNNKGASDARNIAIKHCSGEYIMFIDSDDYIEENALETIYNKAKINNADMAIIGHRKFYEGDSSKKDEVYLFDLDDSKVYTSVEVLDMILNFHVKGYLCDKMFKREVWINNNLFFESRRYVEDWFPIVQHIINSNKIIFVNRELYNYRQHNESSIHHKGTKVIEDYNYAVSNIINYINNNGECDLNSLNIFKLKTFNETIHEFYNVSIANGVQIYKEFNLYKFNECKLSIINILRCNNLSIKEKLAIISWRIKLYHILKDIM